MPLPLLPPGLNKARYQAAHHYYSENSPDISSGHNPPPLEYELAETKSNSEQTPPPKEYQDFSLIPFFSQFISHNSPPILFILLSQLPLSINNASDKSKHHKPHNPQYYIASQTHSSSPPFIVEPCKCRRYFCLGLSCVTFACMNSTLLGPILGVLPALLYSSTHFWNCDGKTYLVTQWAYGR